MLPGPNRLIYGRLTLFAPFLVFRLCELLYVWVRPDHLLAIPSKQKKPFVRLMLKADVSARASSSGDQVWFEQLAHVCLQHSQKAENPLTSYSLC